MQVQDGTPGRLTTQYWTRRRETGKPICASISTGLKVSGSELPPLPAPTMTGAATRRFSTAPRWQPEPTNCAFTPEKYLGTADERGTHPFLDVILSARDRRPGRALSRAAPAFALRLFHLSRS